MAKFKFERERRLMVEKQLKASGISDERVLGAMEKVPRHLFMPDAKQGDAYRNQANGIGEGQTISQPFVVALMTQMLSLTGDEKILEIGTGSGYQTAILAELAKEVFSIERHKALAQKASTVLAKLGYDTVHVGVGDGSVGYDKHAPYDAIMITAATPKVPENLLEQLEVGGRLVAPVGTEHKQFLTLYQRQGKDYLVEQGVPVVFVPLIGKYGWDEKEWTQLHKK